MAADDRFNVILRYVRTLDYYFVAHHDRRGNRQVQLEVLVALVFGDRLGYTLYLNILVLSAQPGQHLKEILSRLPVWLIQEESHLQHFFSFLLTAAFS
jgi:hypothetical protein